MSAKKLFMLQDMDAGSINILCTRTNMGQRLYRKGYKIFNPSVLDIAKLKPDGACILELYHLAKNLEYLSQCEVVYVTPGAKADPVAARLLGMAKEYGLGIMGPEDI